jgi:hypothetical protein
MNSKSLTTYGLRTAPLARFICFASLFKLISLVAGKAKGPASHSVDRQASRCKRKKNFA